MRRLSGKAQQYIYICAANLASTRRRCRRTRGRNSNSINTQQHQHQQQPQELHLWSNRGFNAEATAQPPRWKARETAFGTRVLVVTALFSARQAHANLAHPRARRLSTTASGAGGRQQQPQRRGGVQTRWSNQRAQRARLHVRLVLLLHLPRGPGSPLSR